MNEIYVEPEFMSDRVTHEDDDLGHFTKLPALGRFLQAKRVVEPELTVGRRFYAQFQRHEAFHEALVVAGHRGWAIASRRVDDHVPNSDRLNHPVVFAVYGDWHRVIGEVTHHFPEFAADHPNWIGRILLAYMDLKRATVLLDSLVTAADASWRRMQMNMQITKEEREDLHKLVPFARHSEVYLNHGEEKGEDE